MNFDYCEMERSGERDSLQVTIGCRFMDEPDELYVILMDVQQDGDVKELKLMFNGMDCKYAFKKEEIDAVFQYVLAAIDSTANADWLQGKLAINHT